MALCSQAFNKSIKRSCSSIDNQNSKRICLEGYKFPNQNNEAGVVSSSDDDENSDDEQLCYKLDQIKAKRRAGSRISFSLTPNLELTKLISKYSDDEDEEADNQTDQCFLNTKEVSKSEKHDYEFKLVEVPKSDKVARSKCFEYLVGAIDEAWARYCDATSCIEDEAFYSDENKENEVVPSVHKKLYHNFNYGYGKSSDVNRRTNSIKDDDEEDEDDDDTKSEIIDNYSVNSTDLTDISDNYLNHHKVLRTQQYSNVNKSNSNKSTNQYQKLKDRLTKAKYYLQDLVDSDDYQDLQCFWNRWDMIKYATIELVEDDDDDEVIEATIDDLERDRYFVN